MREIRTKNADEKLEGASIDLGEFREGEFVINKFIRLKPGTELAVLGEPVRVEDLKEGDILLMVTGEAVIINSIDFKSGGD